MELVLDGWHVLQQDATVVLLVGGCMLWSAAVMLGSMRLAAGAAFNAAESFSLLAGLWMLPALLFSGLALLIGLLMPPQAMRVLLLIVAVSAIWWSLSRKHGFSFALRTCFPGLPLLSLLLALVILRLAFLRTVSLPLYFDSAAHYALIQRLLLVADPGQGMHLVFPAGTYYHLGYHVLLAGWVALTGVDLGRLMLVSGQILLAAFPLTLYLLIHRATGSPHAAMVAVILAALGWYMPAHAVNWGKYPALFSLPLLFSAVNLGFLAQDVGVEQKPGAGMLAMALLAAGAAAAIHTRMIVVLAAVFGAWVLSGRWQAQVIVWRVASLVMTLLITAALIVCIARTPLLSPALEPYLEVGIWVTGLTAGLTIFAFRIAPRLSMTCILIVVFVLLALLVPAPYPAAGTLLDRPLVEISLSLPLSVLGAAGFAGLLEFLKGRAPLLKQGATAIISLAVMLNALANYSFTPSACCTFVAADDLVALDWLGKHVPATSGVAIASTPLQLAPGRHPSLEAQADAGVWIQPLKHIRVAPLSRHVDFRDPSTLGLLCDRGLTYVYAGTSPQSFDAALLKSAPALYRARLLLPGASIFEVIGCNS